MSIVNKIPDDLINNFKQNRAAFFVGAGLSVGAGLPSWTSLLEQLVDLAEKQDWISQEKIKEYKELLKEDNKYLFLAEDLKVEIGKVRFSEFLENKFLDSKIHPTENHELIVNIKSNVILTINYDTLLETAYNKIHGEWPNTFMYSDSKSAANNFWKGKFFILKAHGDAKQDIDSIILSQRDYRKVLYREPGYRSLLQSIFSINSIVFLGVSMTDPEFNQLLDYLHDSYHGGGPTHYLLLEEKKSKQTMSKRYLEDFKIETISFKNDKEDYSEITNFLKELYSHAPRT